MPKRNCQLPPSCQTGGCRKWSRNCSIGLVGRDQIGEDGAEGDEEDEDEPGHGAGLARMENQTSPSGETGLLARCVDPGQRLLGHRPISAGCGG